MPVNILDRFWPRRCEICGADVDRPARHICSDCLMRLPFIRQDGCCRRCGRAVPAFVGEFLCEDCRTRRPAFDAAASALVFDGEARRLVLDWKSNRHFWLRDDLVDFIEAAARVRFALSSLDAVLSMPVTLLHRFDRGYNQCAILARALARRLERVCLEDAVVRQGRPARQAGLDEHERRRNVIGTFRVPDGAVVRGRRLLVVDDVMSTGSTLSECARALKAAGAAEVMCVTLARSVRI